VNANEVVAWVDKYFGSIQRGPEVKKQSVPPVRLKESKVITYPDGNAYVPLIYSTFVGVPVGHPDEAAMDVLAYLMGGTRNSTIYKKFVDAEWALQADASNNPLSMINHELAGEFSFTVVGYPYSDIPKLQRMLKSTIDSFGIVGFTDEDLDRAKTNILSNYSSGLEDVSTKANYLSAFWYLDAKNADGSSYNLENDANRYRSLTKADIMRVYERYIRNKFSSTVIITPAQVAEDAEKPKYQSVNPNAGFKSAIAEAEYNGLTLRTIKDNFDRSQRPQPKAITSAKTPKVEKNVLANGLEIWSTYFDETPRVIVQLNIEGGRLLEDGKIVPKGTAELLASAMETGTALRTPTELEKEFEKLGVNIGFGANSTGTSITLSCEKEKLDAAVALLEEMMFKPRWDEAEFKKGKSRAKEGANSSLRNRSVGASNAWRRLMNGDNALGTSVLAEDYDKVSMAHCKAYYNANYAPNLTKMVVVGPLSAAEVDSKFAFLKQWEKKNVIVPKPTPAVNVETPQLFGVKYTDADQSDIYVGFKSLPYDATGKFFQNSVMNFALAGNFNSRLNLNIREEKAWTYGIRGGFSSSYKDLPGTYTISAGVKARATDSAIVEIIDELVRYKNNGITDEEFAFTKSALVASEALEYESIGQKAGYILQMANRNLPVDYADQQLRVLQSMTKEQVNSLAKEQLNLDNMVVVVAGDLLEVQPKLETLGLGKMQVLEPTGAGKIKYLKAGSTSL
ncbi:MAG: M16 family metallopeptidase, partial [Bacteroidota bacterium]